MAEKSITKGPQRLGPNTYYVSQGGGAIIQFEAVPNSTSIDVGRVNAVTIPNQQKQVDVMYWGKSNDLPQYREELILGNNIVPALIERKRNILCGQGWYAYKERFEDTGSGMMKRIVDEVPMQPEQKAFFRKFRKTSMELVGELVKHAMAMPEFIREKGESGKIASVKSLEVKYCRAGKKVGVEIETWYWGNAWQKANNIKPEDRIIRDLPVYKEGTKQKRFVLPLIDGLFNDGYYPIPAYWGGRHWITLSNIIPLFHEANLRNGSLPRWHVVMPHDYFLDYEAMEGATEEDRIKLKKEAKAKEKQFLNDFNALMTDVSKTGRTLFTKSELIEAMGGNKDKRIIVEPLDVDMKDEALLKLYQASNVANVSAQAFHPTLASVETAGKGIGSGTEIRNAFLLYLIIAAPAIRDYLTDLVEFIKEENGWDTKVFYAIRDAELTTLADNPAGVRPAETQIGGQ